MKNHHVLMSYLNLPAKQRIMITALLYILWVIAFTYFSVIQKKEELYQKLDIQLEDAALLAPLLLPKSLHSSAMNRHDQTSSQNYDNTLSLSDFTDYSDITYIYTLILRDDKLFFTSSSATEEERQSGEGLSSYFDHYDDAASGVYDVFDSKEKAFLEYTDQWGSFRSVFIPTYSLDGTFYIVAADLSISHIQELLNKQLYQSIAIGILFLLFVYPIYLAATFRLKNITLALDKKVQTQTSELFQKEKRLSHALKSAQQSWFDLNLITGELDVSDELPKLLKYDPSRFKIDLQTWQKNIHRDDRDKVQALFEACLKTGGPITAEYRLQALDGSWPWIHSVAEIIEWDENNTPSRMIGIHRDISQQKRSDNVLRTLAETGVTEEGDIFKTIVRQLALSHDMRYALIASINPNDNTQVDTLALWANGAFSENFSYTLIDTPCATVLNDTGHTTSFYSNHVQQQFPDDLMLVEMEAESYIGVPLINSSGKAIGIIAMLDDKPMSEVLPTLDILESLAVRANIELERKASKETLEIMAHYDVLTRLPNRTLFADRFTQAVAHSNRTESMLAVCFLDLDDFKPVNDNYGHNIGDQLLIEVANRLKATIREEDTAARQGGDEFSLLLRDIESFAQCEQLLERIRQALAQPYLIDNKSHKVSISIGATIYPLDDADLDTLLRHADQAMYQAKLAGKDQHQLFNAISDQQITYKQTQRQEIKQALENKEFQLYYQPKVNMKTGKVFGAEALIRWIHPTKGLIPPLDFLPAVEGTDLELQIGGWVINEALQQLDNWQRQGIKFEISINVSSHHLQSPAFFDQINDALDKHPDVYSQDVQLEILESSALGDLDAISGIIKSCQNVLGVNVALDDFGTGYSSLTHMRHLSANTIKIDQSFVRDILDDPNDYNIIEGIIALAKAFHRDVIAEGVETDAHGLMLLIMGCNDAQGYGISRPIPAEDIPAWLADYTPNTYWMDYRKQHVTLQDHKVTLLQLTTEQWFNNVTNAILTMDDSGFGDYFMKCHLGAWLSRFEEEGLFSSKWLDSLTQTHEVMFSLAKEMIEQHQAGDIESARARLDEFGHSYANVQSILEQHSQ